MVFIRPYTWKKLDERDIIIDDEWSLALYSREIYHKHSSFKSAIYVLAWVDGEPYDICEKCDKKVPITLQFIVGTAKL